MLINDTLPKIGLIDSGIGGLHILKALAKKIPARYIYRADTAHMPYGNKSKDEIELLGMCAVEKLNDYRPDCIVIACHTLSSILPLDNISALFGIPMIGMIELVTNAALQKTTTGRIGIMATAATIASHAHRSSLLAKNSSFTCFEQACPTLASCIENNPNDPQLPAILTHYLANLQKQAIDTLILGCTHYEAVQSIIQKIMGEQVTLISASSSIIPAVNGVLSLTPKNVHELRSHAITLLVTGDRMNFQKSAQQFLESINYTVVQENYGLTNYLHRSKL